MRIPRKIKLLGTSIIVSLFLFEYVTDSTARFDDQVTAVRFDTTGRYIAIGKFGGTFEVWDRKMRQTLWSHDHKGTPIYGLYFRKGGNQLMVASFRSAIYLYDLKSGRQKKAFFPHFKDYLDNVPESLQAADVDSFGKILAVAGNFFNTVYLIDLEKVVADNQNPLDIIPSEFKYYHNSQDGFTVAVRHKMGISQAVIGPLYSGKQRETFTDLKFCSEGKYLAGTTDRGFLIVWNIESLMDGTNKSIDTGKIEPYVRKVHPQKMPYSKLLGACCDETNLLATIGDYSQKFGQIQLWNTDKGIMAQAITEDKSPLHPGWGRRIAIDRSGHYMISTGDIRYLAWKCFGDRIKPVAKLHYGRQVNSLYMFNTVDFTADSKLAAIAVGPNVFILDPDTLDVKETIGEPNATIEIDQF